jgi:hypothetical protein
VSDVCPTSSIEVGQSPITAWYCRGRQKTASAVTISRAAEILGEDEEALWDMINGM